MKRLLYIFIGLIFSFSIYASEGTIEVFGDNKYKGLKLSPEIYKNANRDLSGIYLKDSKNNTIPYTILSSKETIESLRNEKKLFLINSFQKDKDFYLDYKVETLEGKDIIGTSIRFQLDNKNFFRDIELYGSYDNLNWVKVTEDSLYRTPKEIKDEINFKKEEKYTFFRLKLKNNVENIKLNSSTLVRSIGNKRLYHFIDYINVNFQVKNENTTTIIEIEPLKNLKIKSIEILTDSIFKRKVLTSTNREKILYNLKISSEQVKDTTIDLSGEYLEDNFKIYIENNADKNIEIKGIKVAYYFDYIIFESKNNEQLRLEFSTENKEKPFYDMEYYKTEILKENIDLVFLKDIRIDKKSNDLKTSTEIIDYKFIFNLVIILIALIIGIFILKNISIKNKK